PPLRREVDDPRRLERKHGVSCQQERVRALSNNRGKGGLESVRTSHLDGLEPHANRPCDNLYFVKLPCVRDICRIPEERRRGEPGKSLFEERKPFAHQLRGEEAEPCDVAFRPREAGNDPGTQGIASSRHDDGDRCSRLLGRTRRWRSI